MSNLINNTTDDDDENAFGPHKTKYSYFFTILHKGQDVNKNPQFIQWKKDMEKINDLIIHCPKCYAYFPNKADTYCCCNKCGFSFCFGCNKEGCKMEYCFKWWTVIIPYFGLKEYGDRNIILKISMYIAMLFQVLFTFPLQVLYKIGPMIMGDDGCGNINDYIKYRKKGLIFCFIMLPYQIAFLIIWFYITSLIFFIPAIFYPPYTVYWMGIFWYVQTHFHGGTLYEGDGHYYE